MCEMHLVVGSVVPLCSYLSSQNRSQHDFLYGLGKNRSGWRWHSNTHSSARSADFTRAEANGNHSEWPSEHDLWSQAVCAAESCFPCLGNISAHKGEASWSQDGSDRSQLPQAWAWQPAPTSCVPEIRRVVPKHSLFQYHPDIANRVSNRGSPSTTVFLLLLFSIINAWSSSGKQEMVERCLPAFQKMGRDLVVPLAREPKPWRTQWEMDLSPWDCKFSVTKFLFP